MTRISYLGNHSVPYSTESHVAASLEALGHSVQRLQEGETRATDVAMYVERFESDVFLWTQTYGLAVTGGSIEQRETMLDEIADLGVPTVAYHLDLWWNLDREDQLRSEPYFRCDHVFTTDNLHDRWAAIGVNHHYLPPGVYHSEAYDGTPRPMFFSDIAFVGSWRSYGHSEHHPLRMAMLNALRRKYGKNRFKCWPLRQAIRGTQLTDLYASVKVVVGDSCLAGQVPGYWSDRVAETTGRGGFLIHPYVPGILDTHPSLVTYPAGDWDALIDKVDYYLANPEDRELNRKENAEYTRMHNCYTHRMQTVLDIVL